MTIETTPLPNKPAPSRRRFLAFSAAGAGTVAFSGGVALRAASISAPSENPDLLRLGQEFSALEASFRAADEKKTAARATFETLAPLIPDELLLTREERGLSIGETARNIDGELIHWDSSKEPPRQIAVTYLLNEAATNYSSRSKIGRLIRRKLKVAEAYEAAFEDALQSSGYAAS